jgi:hypothetical protein
LAQNSRQIGTYRLDCGSASTGTAIDITRQGELKSHPLDWNVIS